ncbi:four-helix bundle copper-binding protein [Fulvivirga sp. RKSG066]|uniref:four-helix bundle copper-binding protein n=1 Tax=Fulvivirga aurantia TaxID=2529383 RepID=UPI0012BBC4D7|nr:four-helix bundle copper-binding protein [Fulvivirga aurantia]MTI22773.1 four-helix bundle copper-binding protein [Fulvivirga aurantia]
MKNHKELILKLNECASACQHCSDACLDEEDVSHMINCIRLDRDCADICRLTSQLLSRGSDQVEKLIDVCEAICRKCAEECEKHDNEHCKKCATACRECEEACKMA